VRVDAIAVLDHELVEGVAVAALRPFDVIGCVRHGKIVTELALSLTLP
jgi:hypothetical protein